MDWGEGGIFTESDGYRRGLENGCSKKEGKERTGNKDGERET